MKRKLKPLHILLIAVGLLVVIAIVAKKSGWIGGEYLENVTVEKAELRDIVETVIANGKVQPETEVKISSEISGEIIALHVKRKLKPLHILLNAVGYRDWETDRKSTRLNSSH